MVSVSPSLLLVDTAPRSYVWATLSGLAAVAVGCSSAPSDPPRDRERPALVQRTNLMPQGRCHSGMEPSGGLELVAPGLEARLVGRPASECANQILVIP